MLLNYNWFRSLETIAQEVLSLLRTVKAAPLLRFVWLGGFCIKDKLLPKQGFWVLYISTIIQWLFTIKRQWVYYILRIIWHSQQLWKQILREIVTCTWCFDNLSKWIYSFIPTYLKLSLDKLFSPDRVTLFSTSHFTQKKQFFWHHKSYLNRSNRTLNHGWIDSIKMKGGGGASPQYETSLGFIFDLKVVSYYQKNCIVLFKFLFKIFSWTKWLYVCSYTVQY